MIIRQPPIQSNGYSNSVIIKINKKYFDICIIIYMYECLKKWVLFGIQKSGYSMLQITI